MLGKWKWHFHSLLSSASNNSSNNNNLPFSLSLSSQPLEHFVHFAGEERRDLTTFHAFEKDCYRFLIMLLFIVG